MTNAASLTDDITQNTSQLIDALLHTDERSQLSKHLCPKSQNKLKNISITQLKCNQFQYGCSLHVMIVNKIIKHQHELIALIREKDSQEVLILVLLHSAHYLHQLSRNNIEFTLIIKEPLFKEVTFRKQTIKALLIDNIYMNACLQYTPFMDDIKSEENDDIIALKQKGNQYFSCKQYLFAIHCYSLALKHSNCNKNMELKLKLLCNRSLCYLQINEHRRAFLDAQHALKLNKDSFKAKFRCIKALNGSCQYLAALKMLQSVHKKQIESNTIRQTFNLLQKEVVIKYRESMGVLHNEHNEKIDFALYPSYSHDTNWSKTSDFIGALCIKWINDKKGRGIIATKDIKAGDIVLIEKVFAKGMHTNNLGKRNRSKRDILVMNILKQMYPYLKIEGIEFNASLLNAKRVSFLCSNRAKDVCNQRVPEIDLFKYIKECAHDCDECMLSVEDIEARIDANCYESLKDPNDIDLIETKYARDETVAANHKRNEIDEKMYVGLWLITSFMNHSNEPNAYRIIWYNTMVIIADQDIQKGDEICLSYLNPFISDDDRQQQLNQGWGI